MRKIYNKKYMIPVEQVQQTTPPSWKSYLVPIGATLATAGLVYAGYSRKEDIKRTSGLMLTAFNTDPIKFSGDAILRGSKNKPNYVADYDFLDVSQFKNTVEDNIFNN